MPEPGLSRREARVVRFIDRWFATAPKEARAFRAAERIARLAKTRGI